MRNLLLILMTYSLVACQSISSSDKQLPFVGPSNAKYAQFAPLDALLHAHQSACDGNFYNPLAGYRSAKKLNLFFSAFCSEESTTTQLRLIAQLHQQDDWPQAYLSYFAMLHQQTSVLRQHKLNNIELKKQLIEHQSALQNTQLALKNLKQKLAQIEQQRLASPADIENSQLGIQP
ncbi:hypothetical protein PSECIP111951_00022 [Pseudoalteromonas holothuriae]|uniref:Uncharacterized protein n=1 Tax=Pseudoalteromonas holothuriae TaxID=2963714 RepID=A0ABN8UFC9_9GAMM|nr:hypothetical protein [Pseudoalteromonas sp. CIP111951]CAH9049755.1 hypothetical protein PSECIP111951_00022 [Pseudoalteromonas sp. CIP111951]